MGRPSVGYFRGFCAEEVWVRVLGLLLHLWEEEFFERFNDACGGFMVVDEGIGERCHLQRTRFF